MKAALVNLGSGYVQNIIMVNSLDDPVGDGYKLVSVDIVQEIDAETQSTIDFIKTIDPDYVHQPVIKEYSVNIGKTRWTEELGLFDQE